jgi:predicted RNA-binding protein (TIGR00451 family)
LDDVLRRIRGTADYQFGKGIGTKLFPEGVRILYSRNTGRIRYVLLGKERLTTLRPTDGLFSLSLVGAKRIAKHAKCTVNIKSDVSKFIAKGGDVFAAHVVRVDACVRARDEVIVADETGIVLAVGHALLSAEEMKAFKRGVAVKVRRGNAEES